VRKKRKRAPTDDPVEELRHGWDTHVAFGLAEPAAYVIMYGDPTANVDTAELHEGNAMLEALVARIADAGQLRVSVPHARRLIHAGACGATLSLLSASPDERDASLSEEMREAVLARILAKVAPRKERTVATRAVSLRAVLHEVEDVLTAGEAQLLGEWLDRLSKGSP
jgi:hypothetical protein